MLNSIFDLIRYLLLLLWLFLSTVSFAQLRPKSVDRLLKILKTTNKPTKSAVNAAMDLGNYYFSKENYTLATQFFNKELTTAYQLGDSVAIAWAYYNISFLKEKQGKYTEILVLLDSAQNYAQNKKGYDALMSIMGKKSSHQNQLGMKLESIKTLIAMDKLCRDANDTLNIRSVNYGLCTIYSQEKKYQLSLKHGKIALRLAQQAGDNYDMTISALGIAACYFNTKQYNLAQKYSISALNNAIESKNYYMQGYAMNALGEIEMARKKYTNASNYFDKSIACFKRIKEKVPLITPIIQKGIIESKFNNRPRFALEYLNQALQLSQETAALREKTTIFKELAYVYAKLGQENEALAMIDSFVVIGEKLNEEQTQKLTQELTVKYETEQKELQLEQQQVTLLEKEKQIANAIIGALILFLTLFGTFALYRWQQNRKVVKMQQKFEQTTKQLESFNLTVSHELRYPIIQMRNTLNTLKRKINVPEIKRVEDALTNMDKLVQSMLQLSNVEIEPLNYGVADTKLMVEDIFLELQLPVEFIFHIHELPTINADVYLLRQVFINLIQNAIKFSMKECTPIIEISAVNTNNKYIFEIKDNGVGFAAEKAQSLFRLFGRLHASSMFGGFGVGLVIVKTIVEKHGGRVWAKGEVNEGASFIFELPQ